jgi:hypothetical protein
MGNHFLQSFDPIDFFNNYHLMKHIDLKRLIIQFKFIFEA